MGYQTQSEWTIKMAHHKEKHKVRGGGSLLWEKTDLAQPPLSDPLSPAYTCRQLGDAEDLRSTFVIVIHWSGLRKSTIGGSCWGWENAPLRFPNAWSISNSPSYSTLESTITLEPRSGLSLAAPRPMTEWGKDDKADPFLRALMEFS